MRHALALLLAFSLQPSAFSPAFAALIRVHDPLTGKALGPAGDGVVLVRFKPGADRARIHARRGGLSPKALVAPEWELVELPPGVSVTEALARYRADPDVAWVQPDYVYRPAGVTPSDPLFTSQYALAKISASAAWDIERGLSRKVTIAVLDTGIDRTHPDLSAKLDTTHWAVFCPGATCTGACTPCTGAACTTAIADSIGHGTEVAGIAAAATDNGQGVAGVSWGAALLPVKIFDANGCADSVSLSNAINYVKNLAVGQPDSVGPVVINMSVGEEPDPPGATPSCDSPSDVVTVAVNNAMSANLVLVAAAGNIQPPNFYQDVQCPGRIPGVVAVGATDAYDGVASFSARGPALDVVAPGVSVLTTGAGGLYATADGTSFSAPHVSGLAALARALQPSVSQAEVTAWIYAGADPVGNGSNLEGRGRINAFRTARLAERGTLSDFAGEHKVVAFPNPYRPKAGTLAISVPSRIAGSRLSVKVYGQAGDLVRTLNVPTWDGRNDAGLAVASGMYLLLVETDRGRGKGRVAVLR